MMVVGPGAPYSLNKVHYRAPLQVTPPPPVPLLVGSPLHRLELNLHNFPIDVCLILDEEWEDGQTLEAMAERYWHPWIPNHPARFTLVFYLAFRDAVNVTYDLVFFPGWGVDDGKGNWSGFLGGLQRRECEFSLHVTKTRQDRMDVVDLYFSLTGSSSAFYFLQPRALGSAMALVTPLTRLVWLLVLVEVLVHLFIFRIIAKYDHSEDLENWSSIFILTFGNFAQQGFNDRTRLIASRVLSFSLLIFSFMVCLYYNAAVLQSLLSPNPNTITTVEQIVNSDFHLIIHDATFMRDFDSDEGLYGVRDAITLKMFKKFWDEGSDYRSLKEGIKAVQSGRNSFFADFLAMFGPISELLTDAEICIGYSIPKIRPYVGGLSSRKNSPYREIITIKFTMMKESGIVRRTYDTWFDTKPQCHWRQEFASIGLNASTMGFIVLFIGFALSIIIIMFEIITVKMTTFKKIKLY